MIRGMYFTLVFWEDYFCSTVLPQATCRVKYETFRGTDFVFLAAAAAAPRSRLIALVLLRV